MQLFIVLPHSSQFIFIKSLSSSFIIGTMSFRPRSFRPIGFSNVFSSDDFEKISRITCNNIYIYIFIDIVLLFSMHYFGMPDT